MHKHWFFKFLAIVLAILSGASLILGGLGLVFGEPVGMYENVRRSILSGGVWDYATNAASKYMAEYALTQTDLSRENYVNFFGGNQLNDATVYTVDVRIIESETRVPVLDQMDESREYVWYTSFNRQVRLGRIVQMPALTYYPTYREFVGIPPELWQQTLGTVDSAEATMPPETTEPVATTMPAGETVPMNTEPANVVEYPLDLIPELGEGVVDYDYLCVPAGAVTSPEDVDPYGAGERYYQWLDAADAADGTVYRIEYLPTKEYEVYIGLTQEQLDLLGNYDAESDLIYKLLRDERMAIQWMAIAGAAGLLVSILWLCLVAGGKPRSLEVQPAGTSRIPMDLFLALLVMAGVCVVVLTVNLLDWVIYASVQGYFGQENFELPLLLTAVGGLGGCFAFVLALFFMALSAQAKQGRNMLLKNTLIGRCGKWIWFIAVEVCRGIWKITGAVCRWTGRTIRNVFVGCGLGLRRLNDLMPLTWQWLVASFVLWALVLLAALTTEPALLVLVGLLGAAVILYGAYCFGRLRDSAKRMSRGELDVKIDTGLMAGCFKEFAADLNSLGDVCRDAALEQTKHERMKSELITNVSHDIKTPLTSIINYVDLLRSCETEEQRLEYLEVLDRQSQRLKKLIEDLMEMSKASSGNVTVELASTDVCEGVMQALGEFADRMEQKRLNLVYATTQQPLMAVYDGKLLWRVLSNVLGNVVKHAMAGTRVYVNVYQENGRAVVAVKNISAEPLNITAEELMERFVRGDESRNTEGNGLGLNIARSLMEVQNGDLDLVVDGDLFKVVLSLPLAQ